jgi:hypothetical protein
MIDIIKYNSTSNFDEFINYLNTKKTKYLLKNKNHIDVDLYFYKKANKLFILDNDDDNNYNTILEHLYNIGIHELIYHPKQLYNIFPNIKIIYYQNELYILENDSINKLPIQTTNIQPIEKYIKNNIYNVTFEQLSKILIHEKITKLIDNNNELLIIVFVGNKLRVNDLFILLQIYKTIQYYHLAVCFNSKELYNEYYKYITDNFDSYFIYVSNEFGNDIIPSLLMYQEIRKTRKYNNIIKLHTKYKYNEFTYLTNFVLSKPITKHIPNINSNCNCIGHPKYYIPLTHDKYNKNLIEKYSNIININKCFIYGTIFACKSDIFNAVLDVICKHKAFILNNMYDDNSIIQHTSYPHFIERLFGTINI